MSAQGSKTTYESARDLWTNDMASLPPRRFSGGAPPGFGAWARFAGRPFLSFGPGQREPR